MLQPNEQKQNKIVSKKQNQTVAKKNTPKQLPRK